MKMKTMVVLAVGLLLPAWSWGAEKMKIGYVDLQRVLLTSETGKQAKRSLDKEAEETRKVYKEREKDLQKMKDDLEKKINILSEESRKEKIDSLMKKRDELLRFAQESEMKLAERDRELTKKITEELQDILKDYAEKEGYTLILEKGGILYAPEGMDITDDIIKLYNKKAKK